MRCDDIEMDATGFAERTELMKREVKRHYWYAENGRRAEVCQCCGCPLEEPYAVLDRETGKRHPILRSHAENVEKARSGELEANGRFIVVRQYYCPSLLDRWQGFDDGKGRTVKRSAIDQAYIEIAREKKELVATVPAARGTGARAL